MTTDLWGVPRIRTSPLEFPFDFRQQQTHDVSGGGNPVAGPRLLGDSAAADDVTSFDDENFPSGTREEVSADEAVVTGSDDDAVVHVGVGARGKG